MCQWANQALFLWGFELVFVFWSFDLIDLLIL
jgi:hypothetical protein